MPIIQNQSGIKPSKYCTATNTMRLPMLTETVRFNGTLRYIDAIYTKQASHSQMAVYERGISGRVLVIEAVNPLCGITSVACAAARRTEITSRLPYSWSTR